MQTHIETVTTPRMRCERIRESHFDDVSLLHRDPDVMRTLSRDGEILDDEKTREGLVRQSQHWDDHGFGFWMFYDDETGAFIGRGGLSRYEVDGQTEIGLAYAVVSPLWNRGYATEMTEASLRIGFEELGFKNIGSWTLPTNHTSQYVMEKCGFAFEWDFIFAELPHRFYRVNRERASG